jgi:hypothetical protein
MSQSTSSTVNRRKIESREEGSEADVMETTPIVPKRSHFGKTPEEATYNKLTYQTGVVIGSLLVVSALFAFVLKNQMGNAMSSSGQFGPPVVMGEESIVRTNTLP